MSDTNDFSTFIESERQKLTKKRNAILERRIEIDAELAEVDREISAITAYEEIKRGKTPAIVAPPQHRRPRHTGRRHEVLEAIRRSPEGATRRELLEMLALKGDKSQEQSVSNALTALKKAEHIVLDGDGRYYIR